MCWQNVVWKIVEDSLDSLFHCSYALPQTQLSHCSANYKYIWEFFSHLATSSRIKLCYQRAGRVRTKWRRKLDIHSSWSRNWFFSICNIACVHTIFPITYVLSLPRLLFCEISCNLKQFFACAFHVLFVCCIIAYKTKSLNHLKVF